MAFELLQNGASATTLSSSVNDSATTISVASSAAFPATGNFRVRIDDEILLVTAVSGTTWTVTRGQENTSAASHANAAAVDYVLTKGAFSALRSEIYRQGVSASRPSSPRTGAMYANFDGYTIDRYNGSAWETFGPVTPIVPPPTNFGSGYSWSQQGSATFTRYGQSWILYLPAETSGTLRGLYKTMPSPPYTIECGLRFLIKPANYEGAGMLWRDGSSGKQIHFGCMYHSSPGAHIGADKYNADGTYNSSYNSPVTGNARMEMLGFPLFWRLVDDNTNRFMQVSQNGRFWNSWHIVGRTDFLTATQVGFAAQSSNNEAAFLEVFHYTQY